MGLRPNPVDSSKLIKTIFSDTTTGKVPFPDAQRTLDLLSKPRAKARLSVADKEQCVALSQAGQSPNEIAELNNWQLSKVVEAIRESMGDAGARQRVESQVELANEAHNACLALLAAAVTPKALAEAQAKGAVKDLVTSAKMAQELRVALLEDAKERLGAHHLDKATSLEQLIETLAGGISFIQEQAQRQTGLKRLRDAQDAQYEEIPSE